MINSQQSLLALHIITLIETALSNKQDMFSYSIKLAIKRNTPVVVILQTIKEQAADNRPVVEELLGTDIVEMIINFETKN